MKKEKACVACAKSLTGGTGGLSTEAKALSIAKRQWQGLSLSMRISLHSVHLCWHSAVDGGTSEAGPGPAASKEFRSQFANDANVSTKL